MSYWRRLFWFLPASFLVPLAVLADSIRRLNFGRDGPLQMLTLLFIGTVAVAELLLVGVALLGARFALRGRTWVAGLMFGGILLLQLSPFIWMGPYNRGIELVLAVPAVVAAVLLVFWIPWSGRAEPPS